MLIWLLSAISCANQNEKFVCQILIRSEKNTDTDVAVETDVFQAHKNDIHLILATLWTKLSCVKK